MRAEKEASMKKNGTSRQGFYCFCIFASAFCVIVSECKRWLPKRHPQRTNHDTIRTMKTNILLALLVMSSVGASAVVINEDCNCPKESAYKEIENSQDELKQLEMEAELRMRVDTAAHFRGGDQALATYIAGRIQHPAKNKLDSTKHAILCRFIVERDGRITQPQLMTKSDDVFNEEAERFLATMPRWVPARSHGKNVRSWNLVQLYFGHHQEDGRSIVPLDSIPSLTPRDEIRPRSRYYDEAADAAAREADEAIASRIDAEPSFNMTESIFAKYDPKYEEKKLAREAAQQQAKKEWQDRKNARQAKANGTYIQQNISVEDAEFALKQAELRYNKAKSIVGELRNTTQQPGATNEAIESLGHAEQELNAAEENYYKAKDQLDKARNGNLYENYNPAEHPGFRTINEVRRPSKPEATEEYYSTRYAEAEQNLTTGRETYKADFSQYANEGDFEYHLSDQALKAIEAAKNNQ